MNTNPEELHSLSLQQRLRDEWSDLDGASAVEALPDINAARQRISEISKEQEVHVLVTGSFRLVGGLLSILEG